MPRNPAPSVKFDVESVWAAACAAQRINGSYVKTQAFDLQTNGYVGPKRNRDVMMECLSDLALITDADRAQGQSVLNFLRGDLTMRALQGQLSEFDQAVSRCVAVETFDSVQHRYEMAVVASLPSVAQRNLARQDQDARMRSAAGAKLGPVGNKVQIHVEVISSSWSQNYGIYWIRGITDADQAVTFSSRQAFDTGSWLTVRGNVKGHRDNVNLLNRVKVL